MKPEVRIFKEGEELSRAAAALFVREAAVSIRQAGFFQVALNGGGTPARLFQLLATEFRERVEWSRVHFFWGDERCVPPDDPGSNYAQARDLFLRYVPVPPANIQRIKGELGPVKASLDYRAILKKSASPAHEWPRFDLVYLGLGEDGHTASLFPGSTVDVSEPVIPVTAHYEDRPAERVTLTPVVFNKARTVVFMATGQRKAAVFAEVMGGRYNPELYPAQRIQPDEGRVVWLVDEAAASRWPAATE